ncbi:T9SS type A sorting domain-containing protein, partial [candidate division KSB1 bacterium]|nr:T9SS type A sorting domain-containing protein [candidate division KSB1 bacterium]
NIDDAQSTFTINAQFGSIDPIFYSAWDFDNKIPTDVEDLDGTIPTVFALEQNYPNPFNPVTRIAYSIAGSVDVRLTVYNVLGKEVVTLVDEKQQPGFYEMVWDGRDMSGRQAGSGLYFYKLIAGDFVKTHKMMLLK